MPVEFMHRPEDYDTEFDPDAYLQFYFSKEAIEDGTRVSLFALPTIPEEERRTLLDIGAGPTVYSALCFRDVVREVYLTDYVHKNLDILKDWLNNTNPYDWAPTIKVIKRSEGGFPPSEKEIATIEDYTRLLVKRGGIYFADVHLHDVVPDIKIKQTRNLRPGGKFILGSVLEDDAYNSGRQKIFSLLYLTEKNIMDALQEADIDIDTAKKYVLEEEGVMFLMASKN